MTFRHFAQLAAFCLLTLPACVPLVRQAANGNAEAQFRYGRKLLTRKNQDRDAAGAFSWFMAAAQQGHPRATAAVALCYERGLGTPRDRDLARQWYGKAERLGHWDSVLALAAMDLQDGLAPQAARRLEPLCELHHLQTEIMLAALFLSADSPYYAPEIGVRYLRYAAMDGSPEAAKLMSVCYASGIGVPRNEKLAQGWLNISQDIESLSL